MKITFSSDVKGHVKVFQQTNYTLYKSRIWEITSLQLYYCIKLFIRKKIKQFSKCGLGDTLTLVSLFNVEISIFIIECIDYSWSHIFEPEDKYWSCMPESIDKYWSFTLESVNKYWSLYQNLQANFGRLY